SALTGRTGGLPAAKRLHARPRAGGRAGLAVRVEDSGLRAVHERLHVRLPGAEDARGQAVVGVVEQLQRLVEGVEGGHGHEGKEELLPVEGVLGREGHHGGGHEGPVVVRASAQTLTAGDDLAVGLRLSHRVLEALHGRGVDHRAHEDLVAGRIPHHDGLRPGAELLHERVVLRTVHVDAAEGAALLSGEAERRTAQPSTASSRLADSVTMAPFFPPISIRHGRMRPLLDMIRNSSIPTSELPVKATPSSPGWLERALPTVSPEPCSTWKTPAGMPASRTHS